MKPSRLTLEQLVGMVRRYVATNLPRRAAVRLRIDQDDGDRLQLPIAAMVAVTPDEPDDDGPHTPTPCERDILGLIEETDRRYTVVQVLAALEGAGKIHGESTVRKALANLCRRTGLLTNKRDSRGKGYGLVEWDEDERLE